MKDFFHQFIPLSNKAYKIFPAAALATYNIKKIKEEERFLCLQKTSNPLEYLIEQNPPNLKRENL